MTTAVAAVAPDVQEWLDDKGIEISTYGTVRLVKCVSDDGLSVNSGAKGRLKYEPGTTVVCPDYQRHNDCGQGLHFSATAREARASVNPSRPKYLVCDVDVETLCVIDGGKVKSRFCHVRFEGDESDFGRFT